MVASKRDPAATSGGARGAGGKKARAARIRAQVQAKSDLREEEEATETAKEAERSFPNFHRR